MLKGLGSLLVMAGSLGIGWWYSICYIRRYHTLFMFKKAMIMIQGEIGYGKTPLPVTIEEVAERTEGICQTFFKELAARVKEGECSMETMWSDVAEYTISDREMKKEDKEVLKALGNTMGYLDTETQIQALRMYIKRLDISIQEMEKEKQNKTKLYPVLGTVMGALLCVVLV